MLHRMVQLVARRGLTQLKFRGCQWIPSYAIYAFHACFLLGFDNRTMTEGLQEELQKRHLPVALRLDQIRQLMAVAVQKSTRTPAFTALAS